VSKKREPAVRINDLPQRSGEPVRELRPDESEGVKGGIIAVLIGLAKPKEKPEETAQGDGGSRRGNEE